MLDSFSETNSFSPLDHKAESKVNVGASKTEDFQKISKYIRRLFQTIIDVQTEAVAEKSVLIRL